MGAEVLHLSIRTSINISGLLSICASISPTSPSPKPLAVMLRQRDEFNNLMQQHEKLSQNSALHFSIVILVF